MIKWRQLTILLALCLLVVGVGVVVAQDAGDVTIEVVGWGAGQNVVYEQFMENNPEITVTEQLFDFAELNTFYKTRFLAGDAPDIIQIQPGSVRDFQDNLLPLSDLIASDPDLDVDKFVQPVLGTTTVDGVLYAIPQHPIVSGMIWYNADIFNELGLEIPTNYTELVNVAHACRDAGYQPLILNGADAWNRLIVTEQFFAYVAPGKMAQAVAGEIPWTDPDLVEAMGWWKTFVDDGVFQDGVIGADYTAYAPFDGGQGCMALKGSWAKGSMLVGIRPEAIVGNDLPMAFPDITNSGAGWTPAISGGHAFAINRDSENIEAAWQVLKQIILTGDPLANYPVIVPVYDTDMASVILGNASDPEQLKTVTDFELGAWKLPTMLDDWVHPEVSDVIGEMTAGVATGQISPEDAMAEVQAVAQRVLGE